VTIGRPLPSYHAGILAINEDGPATVELLDIAENVEGELAIGGPCVGIGYVGRADLTAQKFLPHPLFPGERLYRTGDRVRLQADGKIVFKGRIDTQVKHRGFRIELGEIETLLSSHPHVQAAAVILARPDTEIARLEAFVVLRPDAVQDVASIMELCSQRLPSYMRPEEIIFLNAEEMPRLPSGKINAKALHDISARKLEEATAQAKEASSDRSDSGYESDMTNGDPILGLLLAALSQSFPQVARIRPDSDFFDDLGGHSLIAAMLVSRLRQTSHGPTKPFSSIGLPDIYEGRTPAGISARFQATTDKGRISYFDAVHVSENGTGPHTGDFLPVSRLKYTLCGLAQVPCIVFLFFVHSVEFLVPYLLFDFLVSEADVGLAVLATYGVFVVIPPCLTMIAVLGKWIVLGKAREGEYPLYGVYYFRWWLAERLMALANPKLIANSPLYPLFLRTMGCKIGNYCHIGSLSIGAACDLVTIGNDVVIGGDVKIAVSVVERGRLVLKSVTISDDAIIGSNSVIEGGASVGEASEVGALSMVPCGLHVPQYERYHGSPARFERAVIADQAALGRRTRPSVFRYLLITLVHMAVSGLMLPLLYFVPQIPGLLLFDLVELRHIDDWAQVAIFAVPIAFAYQILVFSQLLLFRHVFLGRMREGKRKLYSAWYLRFWFIERLMDLALGVLHPVFASLYIVPFLRALGVKIGRRAEVSTARGLSFELLEIGEESFVADMVLMGDHQLRGNEITFRKTKLEKRAFAGNASLLPDGTVLASGTLVGVLSIPPPPEQPLPPNVSCFGSPPVLMPARQRVEGHSDDVLFNPSRGRIAARLMIEGLRIIMPRAMLIFGLGFSLEIAYLGYNEFGVPKTLLLLPAFYFLLFALPSLLFVALLKWTLIGRYRDSEWPLWSLNVWLSEAVTSTWETITEPLLASLLVGTPYLAMCFRLMGVKIGSRVTLLHSDITEYDCVSIGDEAIINEACGAQTHLFEDRIMKIGQISIGKRATLKPYSVCLPGSTICDNAQLGCLSLLMKGETLPEGTAWEGAPVRPRAVRVSSMARASSLAGSDGTKGSGSMPSTESLTESKSIDSRLMP
jgi:non-ribosomal peptide synthetase-like protein